MKQEDDLVEIHDQVLKAWYVSVADFKQKFTNTIQDYDFKPGALV
jgi:hypothetical protein